MNEKEESIKTIINEYKGILEHRSKTSLELMNTILDDENLTSGQVKVLILKFKDIDTYVTKAIDKIVFKAMEFLND